MGDAAREKCFSLATILRHNHIPAEVDLYAKKTQNAIQNAVRIEAVYCAVIGSDELEKGTVQLKHLETRQQTEVSFHDLVPTLHRLSAI